MRQLGFMAAALTCCMLVFIYEVEPAAAEQGASPPAAVDSDPLETGPAIENPPTAAVPLGNEAAGAGSVALNELQTTWFESGPGYATRGGQTRDHALALGVESYEAAARAMMATADPASSLSHALLAVSLAPDLPMAHMALAGALQREGEWVAAISAAANGLLAIPRHPEASIWLIGSLLVIFATVLVFGSMAFIAAVGSSVASAATHDLGDFVTGSMPGFARAALFASILIVPLALGEGILGLLVVLFVLGIAYGTKRHRVALFSAAVFLVLGVYIVLGLAGTVLTALDSDPVSDAVLAVARGNETPLEIELLVAQGTDRQSSLALAARTRRSGDVEGTLARYEAMLEAEPGDPVLLGNIGNLYFAQGDTDTAIHYYERATAVEDSATLWFNLSQAYARGFRMEQFENALHQAQSIDAERVGELSKRGDTGFVADLPLSIDILQPHTLALSDDGSFSEAAMRMLAPGWLGRSWMNITGALAAAMLLGSMLGSRWEQSSSCKRCGRRICVRCDESIWNNELCDGCHHLFHRTQSTDPQLRTARINELSAREARLEKLWFALSVCVPGVSGLRARRPDLALIGILLFGWALAIGIWNEGVVPDPLALGGVGPLAFLISGLIAGLFYVIVLFSGILIQRNR